MLPTLWTIPFCYPLTLYLLFLYIYISYLWTSRIPVISHFICCWSSGYNWVKLLVVMDLMKLQREHICSLSPWTWAIALLVNNVLFHGASLWPRFNIIHGFGIGDFVNDPVPLSLVLLCKYIVIMRYPCQCVRWFVLVILCVRILLLLNL